MPVLFPRNKRLQETVETYLSLRLVRTLFSSSSVHFLSEPVSACGVGVNIIDRSRFSASVLSKSIGQGHSLPVIGTISQASPASFVSGISCAKQLLSDSSYRSLIAPPQRSLMASCISFSQSNIKQLDFNTWRIGPTLKFGTFVYLSRKNKGFQHCMRVSGCLKDQQPHGNNMLYRYFWSDINGMSWGLNPFEVSGTKDFHSSCLSPQSAGAASDVSLDGSIGEEQHGESTVSSDQKKPGDRTLKLLSGSCYLPHPDKEETGGEDAHFICVEEQAIGVADGVGGWADLGVNAGEYSRELMSHSVDAIQQEPKGSIDPSRVLEKAYLCTKARGSSTACIIALTEEGIHAVNLGDSGFIVVREGSTIFRSPVQQHDFNFTYQLECGQNSDPPSSAQVFNLPVTPGDVVVAGTDGLFDNLYNNEIEAVVADAIKAGLGPQATAQRIAALARQHALDRNRQTPFSAAAQEAGYRYYGGKLDDITVVVSYVAASNT